MQTGAGSGWRPLRGHAAIECQGVCNVPMGWMVNPLKTGPRYTVDRFGSCAGRKASATGQIDERSRRELMTLLAALILVWDTAATSALAWIVAHGGHAPALPLQITQMPSNIGLAAIHIAFLALAAPLAEELFFRGWLWSALGKSWSPARTLTWTSGLWLAMHALDGTWRSVILLPTGIILGLARHYGDSVRASLLLHVMNNSIVVLVQPAVLLASSGAG
jgi:membrane protease YdiL (CAAX protease family)